MKLHCFTAACLILTSLAIASGEFTTLGPKAAQREYEAKVGNLVRQFEREIDAARQEYVASLKTALNDATKAANLDEALRIRQEIARHEDPVTGLLTPPQLSAAQRSLQARLVGTRWQAPATSRTFTNDAVTTQVSGERKALPWAPVSDKVAVIQDGDTIELLLFSDDHTQAWRSAYKIGKSKMVWERAK